jgi:carboxypeptidase C (cathepsin A)
MAFRHAFASFWLLTFVLTHTECVRRLPSEVGPSRRVKDRQATVVKPVGHMSDSNNTSNVQRDLYVPVPASPDEHLVQSLPLMNGEFPTQHWAGHLPASSSNDKYFFYWLFAPSFATTKETIGDEDVPLIIWLNGGPACSSMDGLFVENGPIRLKLNAQTGNYEVVPDPHSWHMAPAYTLYIDQPVGTGLSFTTSGMYPRNDREVNTDLYYFLQSFFKLHSDKFVDEATRTVHRKLYFSGESYAGKCIYLYLLRFFASVVHASKSTGANLSFLIAYQVTTFLPLLTIS